MGSLHIGRSLGYRNVIASDVGGTSFDLGMVVDASVRSYEFRPIIDRWMVGISMLQATTMGAGGGSIAWINELLGGRLEVGPRSAGSYPGPACYDLGGTEPTTTDADVVLGYISPDGYFNGRMPLDRDKAVAAIATRIAEPLGVTVDEAAALIRRIVEENMASAIEREVHLRGYHPEDFVLFAFGGGGPTHVAGYGADVPTSVIFPQAPVFSALGSSVMDIMHVYEQSKRMLFLNGMTQQLTDDYEAYNAPVREMVAQARADLTSEGLDPDQAVFSVELDMLYGGQVQVKRVSVAAAGDPPTWTTRRSTTRSRRSTPRRSARTWSTSRVAPTSSRSSSRRPCRRRSSSSRSTSSARPTPSTPGSREAYWPRARHRVDTPGLRVRPADPRQPRRGPGSDRGRVHHHRRPARPGLSIDEHGLGLLQHRTSVEASSPAPILEGAQA